MIYKNDFYRYKYAEHYLDLIKGRGVAAMNYELKAIRVKRVILKNKTGWDLKTK